VVCSKGWWRAWYGSVVKRFAFYVPGRIAGGVRPGGVYAIARPPRLGAQCVGV